MHKYFIILLFISASLAQTSNNKKYQNLKPNSVELWENENKEIKNPELKKEIMKLNKEFQIKRENIKNEFKEKIKPLKIQKEKDISNLKEQYLNKRKFLFEKYGVENKFTTKPKNKKKKTTNKKPLPYYKKHRQIPTE